MSTYLYIRVAMMKVVNIDSCAMASSLVPRRRKIMKDQTPDSEKVPMMQKLLDNPFLLLFLGVASPAVLYLGWGLAEIFTIPMR